MLIRFASNMFEKKFDLQFVKFGKLRLGEENGHQVMVVDIEKAVADDILERLSSVKLPKEVQIKECLELPTLIDDRSNSNHGGRDNDRREFGRSSRSSGSYENDRSFGRRRESRPRSSSW